MAVKGQGWRDERGRRGEVKKNKGWRAWGWLLEEGSEEERKRKGMQRRKQIAKPEWQAKEKEEEQVQWSRKPSRGRREEALPGLGAAHGSPTGFALHVGELGRRPPLAAAAAAAAAALLTRPDVSAAAPPNFPAFPSPPSGLQHQEA